MNRADELAFTSIAEPFWEPVFSVTFLSQPQIASARMKMATKKEEDRIMFPPGTIGRVPTPETACTKRTQYREKRTIHSKKQQFERKFRYLRRKDSISWAERATNEHHSPYESWAQLGHKLLDLVTKWGLG
jgi:hypothetical protein